MPNAILQEDNCNRARAKKAQAVNKQGIRRGKDMHFIHDSTMQACSS